MKVADLGRSRIPAHSGGTFLRDRADGTVWLLTSRGAHVGLTDEYVRVFSTILDSADIGDWRVFATGGRLAMEQPVPEGVTEPPLMTHRILPGRDIYQVTEYLDERLAYTQVNP